VAGAVEQTGVAIDVTEVQIGALSTATSGLASTSLG
jgi:hypothetical protein